MVYDFGSRTKRNGTIAYMIFSLYPIWYLFWINNQTMENHRQSDSIYLPKEASERDQWNLGTGNNQY